MGHFTIEVTETLNRLVEVEAANAIEALSTVNEAYRRGERVLTADDFQEVSVSLLKS